MLKKAENQYRTRTSPDIGI